MFKELTALPTEQEIKSFWKHVDKTFISIICTCFNQQDYIADAINSFLAQKTEYAFEVIIHDDASTDKTCDILKAYEQSYPSIVKVIYQTENQYSKGNVKVENIALRKSRGEFIALCEGDDFWVDELKLQKQLEGLLACPDLKLCFTSAYTLAPNGQVNKTANYNEKVKVFPFSDIIKGGGALIPTASIFMRRSVMESLPSWFENAPVGDIFIQINGSKPQGALYLPDVTVVYRVDAVGSWSVSQKYVPEEKVKSQVAKLASCYNLLAEDNDNYDDYQIAKLNLYIASALKAISQQRYGLAKYFINKSKEIPHSSKRKQVLIAFQHCLPFFRLLHNAVKSFR